MAGALVVLAGAGACLPGQPVGHPAVDLSFAAVVVDPPVYAEIDLYSDGVVIDGSGLPQTVPVGTAAADHPGRRVEQDAWLAGGTVPGPARYADLAEHALRDLDALVLPGGVAIAGATDRWRYVWPRDASFVAAALARTGHPTDAHEVLAHLQTLQQLRSTGGVFEARYTPDGTGAVPDDRGPQLDGNGWVLWAVAQWYAEARPGPERRAQLEALRPLVTTSVAAIRANLDLLTGLPVAYPDYWEVPESEPTLGTLAALLLGARAIGPVLQTLGEPGVADLVAWLDQGAKEGFSPHYPRYPGERERDTAVAFLMPPFAPPDDAVERAWAEAAASMARPAGGLAPGGGWAADGVSWTPTTAVFALTAAASGQVDQAESWLDWLDAHRTPRGALPEKVLADGSPSAVAPLAWTCALVLLTLDELGGGSSGPWTSAAAPAAR